MNDTLNLQENGLVVAPAPHIRYTDRTRTIMLDVTLALMPALLWGVYMFGKRVLLLTVISIATAILSEWCFEKLMHRRITVYDGSALVTGLLVALNVPVAVPLWLPALGSAFAILVVKQLFGGLGKNFVNPALAGRMFLFLSFPAYMTTFTSDRLEFYDWYRVGAPMVDGYTTATPLATMADPIQSPLFADAPRKWLLLGYHAGCIGEICAAALVLGGLYLLLRRVITWHIPVAYLGTVALVSLLFPQYGAQGWVYMLCQLCSGGLLLGAIFMATDYVTAPLTGKGKLIYGVGCGLITMLVRVFGSYTEGVSVAILVMNLLVPYIDMITQHRRFGEQKNPTAPQA